MSLNARERQALRSIEGGLADSDPDLVAKLASICRLMADEDGLTEAPGRAGRRHGFASSHVRWRRGPRRGHVRRYSTWTTALMAVWLAMACALIATAAVLSHPPANGPCSPLAVACASQPPTGPQPGAR